jgi:eukaryotic-like serine/threonine-protein kinase
MDHDEELAAQRIGSQVGMWTLERVLGVGGMASVYLGRRTDGAVAAVKLLHPYFFEIDAMRKRFLREGPIGSALAALGPLCEGLPQVYESGVVDGAAIMVMELLDGETVFDRLARMGTIPVGQVIWLAQKVLDVLVIAHAYGIFHRDLKPENIHIGDDGRVKVLDFGVARVTEALPEGTGELPEQTVTRMGTALGSGPYMAPEQARGDIRAIDGRTDLFGLGATMFGLLSGRTIHGDVPESNMLVAAAMEAAPALVTVAPTAPETVCAVVDRALAFHQNQRYPDATTMRADIAALRSGREPPYVMAVASGRIQPGAPLSG